MAKNIDKLIIVVIFISILPILIKGFRSWNANRKAKTAVAPAPAPTVGSGNDTPQKPTV